ncbi:hypothetical protein LCGC14_0510130 [marine sediment metagenome]|uniref:Thymidylate synthase/dCMP hydroxymethylase domain-containing protein n=1 Tax=marine sediment metagenome TaxID=412755 RepID=A0A0F9SJU3_9ZZZZ
MDLVQVEARDLPEAWYLCIRECMDRGHIYTIDRGSHQGRQRKEIESITLLVKFPGSRPIVPVVAPGVPPPSTQEYVEQYLPYLLTGHKQVGEQYTYGEDIEHQLPELIRMYREDGFGTNQACLAVGNKESIFLPDPQCLRVIDTRVRNNKLDFYVYFRSWDLWAGLPSNLAAIQILKEYIASEIGAEDGELVAYSKGLHLYDHHWDVANIALHRNTLREG